MKKMNLKRIALCGLLSVCLVGVGCNAQSDATKTANVLQGLLNIAQAEEPVLPPADATILTSWVGLGNTLEGELNTCIAATTAKGALLNCFNAFAGGLLSPAELAQLRILSPTTQAKVQLYATAVIIALNVAVTSLGGAAQPMPVIAPAPASSQEINRLRGEVMASLR